jgi:hypothetical protein
MHHEAVIFVVTVAGIAKQEAKKRGGHAGTIALPRCPVTGNREVPEAAPNGAEFALGFYLASLRTPTTL